MNKEVRQLCKALRKQGFDLDQSGRHIRATKAGTKGSVTISRTPSDPRSIKNSVGHLRKMGFEWKGR